MGNAPATPPALEEVEAAEAHANELARAYFAAALRAKTLRMARAVAGADEWVPLRATRGDKRRFMKSDRAAAVAKYVWFRRAVRERRWRGYRLYDYDLGCHGWMISDETRADVFLRRFEDGTFTVTSEFRTRYDSVGDETFVFRDLDEFLKRFPHASSLDHHVEEHDDAAAADDDDDDDDTDDAAEGKESDAADGESSSDDDADEPLEDVVLSFVETRIWAEESRRAERLSAREEAEESE